MKRKISLYRILGLLILHVLIVTVVVQGGSIGIFINIPSIILVFGGTFFMLLATYQQDIFNFMKDAALDSISKEIEPNQKYVKITKSARKYVLAFGIIGAIICLIQQIWIIGDTYSFLLGVAVCLLTILYGLFCSNILCVYLEQIYSK